MWNRAYGTLGGPTSGWPRARRCRGSWPGSCHCRPANLESICGAERSLVRAPVLQTGSRKAMAVYTRQRTHSSHAKIPLLTFNCYQGVCYVRPESRASLRFTADR